MYCSYCGKLVDDGAAFCPNCGGKVDAQPAAAIRREDPSQAAKREQAWKLVSGVITLIVAALALLSVFGAVAPDLPAFRVTLIVGFFGAALTVAAGICSIVLRKRPARSFDAVLIALFSASMIACFSTAGTFLDLSLCGLWTGVCAFVASIIAALK